MNRTKLCGTFRENDVGNRATADGWILSVRDMGGVIFIDLYDHSGVLQVVCDAHILGDEEFHIAEGLKNQSVIEVSGLIRKRGEETYNPKIPTGTVELAADALTLISGSDTLPYPIDDAYSVSEDVRLHYRYLDLRRPAMQNALRFRHRLTQVIRTYLDGRDFVEVETPMLGKSTPEGAREYLVPSRVHPGKFYALPQSPQIYKQLLMVGGLDRYYQIARCFRDEDLRADRQPEFTQVDMEMSFVCQEDILVHLESLFKYIMREVKHVDITEPFQRLTWNEAMDVYGSDKPDLRFGLPIIDITDIARKCSFDVFRRVADRGGVVRAINVKHHEFTRSEIEDLTACAVSTGAKGMAWIAVRENGELYSVLTKYFKQDELDAMMQALGAEAGDFIIFAADRLSAVRKTLGTLRLKIGDMLSLRPKDVYKFLIVTDFPQFEYSEEEGRWLATHHPFTMPYEEDLQYLESDPGRVRAQAYDFVLNGIELGSGSIRIHRSDVQSMMFRALGFTPQDTEERFGFMINAFRYGTPPHGGFAFGLDRLTMLLLGAESLRDIIAFPKTKDASCPLTSAPAKVDAKQLDTLNISLKSDDGDAAEKKAKAKKASPQINIAKIASLARLDLTDEEMTRLPRELESIVDFAGALQNLDTDGVDAKEHIGENFNVFREDEIREPFDRKTLLDASPKHTDECFVVGKVI